MKIPTPKNGLLVTVLFAALAATSAHAADKTKANNATDLNLAGSWSGGSVPTASDLAIFDGTLDGSFNSYAIGAAMTWNGISFRNAAVDQTIAATGTSVLTLANGSPGIDMTSAAIANLTVGARLGLGTAGGQTFNVANSDRVLTMSGVISGTGPLTKSGAGTFKSSNAGHTYTGGTIISGGTLQLGVANGLAAGTVTVQSGGTLDLNHLALTGKANTVVHIAGTGVGGNGALVSYGTQLNTAVTNLVLDADASVGAHGRFDIRPVTTTPVVDLAGHTLTKLGANAFWLQQLTPTAGNIVVQEGTLGLNAVTLTSVPITVQTNAIVAFFRNGSSAISTITSPITLQGGSTANLNGTDTTDPIEQSVGSAITLSGDSTVYVQAAGAVLELAGSISGPGGVTKTGPGTLLLSGPATYSGNTTNAAGVLTLGSAWKSAGAVVVNDGASVEFKPAALNAIVNLSSLTLGTAANTEANFNMGGFANPSGAVANVTNAITLNGTTTINLSGTSGLTSGTFKLITFGSIEGTGGFAVGLTPGFIGTLATNGNSIEITLEAATLAWRGNVSGTWQVSNPGAQDWYNLLLGAPAGFANGLPVLFNDSLTGTPNVNITETVQPASVLVSNVSTAYTFSGPGKITGSSGLTKTGTGTLALMTLNDYTGATTIKQGTLQLGLAYAIPSNTVPVVVTNSGILDLNGYNQTVIGLNGNGTISNSSPAPAELRFAAGSAGTFAGVIADNGSANLTLYKTGGGYQTLTGNNTFSGGTSMNGGSLFLGSDRALGQGSISLAFTAQIASDSTAARSLTNDLIFSGGSTKNIGDTVNNGVLSFYSSVGFSGGTRAVSVNSDVVFNGAVSDGAINKSGVGTLTINGTDTCTATTISAGTLAGTGSFSGPVAINTATLSPGTGIGTVTMTDALSFTVNSTAHMEINAANNTSDLVQGLASVAYNGTLEVTNLAGTVVNGQTFQLFSATATTGAFTATNLPALSGGLVWNWNPASGTLSVVQGMATTPTNVTFSVSGGNLNLSWPGSHLGWIAQSNSVALADTNFWFDIAGSAAVTNLSFPIDPSTPKVFYRIRKP